MARVINPETAGKQRNRMVKGLVISMRALMSQPDVDDSSLDVAAFMALSLDGIADTIEATVVPWEKRNYWVKADRFRMEWAWAESLGADMRRGVLEEDWGLIAATCVRIADKVKKVQVSDRHRMGEPWVGAYQALVEGG
jgi:hypothetical protein